MADHATSKSNAPTEARAGESPIAATGSPSLTNTMRQPDSGSTKMEFTALNKDRSNDGSRHVMGVAGRSGSPSTTDSPSEMNHCKTATIDISSYPMAAAPSVKSSERVGSTSDSGMQLGRDHVAKLEGVVAKLMEVVDGLKRRIEKLENPASGNQFKKASSSPVGSAPKPNLAKDETPAGRKFQLTTEFFYGGDAEQRQNFKRFESYPFIRVLWVKRGKAENPGLQSPLSDSQEATFVPGSAEIMQFCVESRVMRDFLDGINDTLILGEPLAKLEADDGTLCFKKPFRWLVQHRSLIEEKLINLESEDTRNTEQQRLRSLDASQVDTEEGGSQGRASARDSSILENDLLAQLRYLLCFMEEHMKPQIQLDRDAREGNLKTIRFQDLWMLYRPGALVYTSFRKTIKAGDYETSGARTRTMHTIKGTETPQAYKIIAVVGGMLLSEAQQNQYSTSTNIYSPLRIVCYYIDFSRQRFGCVCLPIDIAPFEGERGINSLEVYPLAYAPDPKEPLALGQAQTAPGETTIREFLRMRGNEFIQVSEASHRLYEGLTWGSTKINAPVIIDFELAYNKFADMVPQPMLPSPDEHLNIDVSGRTASLGDEVIADFKGKDSYNWYKKHQRRLLAKTRLNVNDTVGSYPLVRPDASNSVKRLTDAMNKDDHVLLLPGTVYAFALRARKWVSLDLRFVKPVGDEAGWTDLILPSGVKDMVQAVVETHAAGSRSTAALVKRSTEADIVRGKGKGCIILLHGEPGVGKTSTAGESNLQAQVPAMTGQRLISAIGDIGYQPDEVEQSLQKHFTLAQQWGCVVLLDEADVFLAKRSDDLKRNGLVSVFLRILEYYQGILFLTTNRVGSFDDAFRSRLHLTLYYPKLERKQTVAIWKVNIRRLNDLNKKRFECGQDPIEVQEGEILSFAKKHWEKLSWNGRQIRNAFQTAVALAEFDAKKINAAAKSGDGKPHARPVMTKEYFQTIAGTSMQFDEYLYLTHGGNDLATNAKKEQVRWDYELRDRNKSSQQHQHNRRLGGSHGLSSDSASDSSSSSKSDDDTDSESHSSHDLANSEDDSGTASMATSDEDRKKKQKDTKK
ncbi:AAA family ATPase, partial [Apiospora marii]